MDLMALWDREMIIKGRDQIKFKLFLKVRVFYPYKKDENQTISFLYI